MSCEPKVLSATNSAIFSWGSNAYGALGKIDDTLPKDDDGNTYSDCPHRISQLDGHHVTQVACAHGITLAVSLDGGVWAWGCATYGLLGSPDRTGLPAEPNLQCNVYQPSPQRVTGLQQQLITQVACSDFHCLALALGGDVHAWGSAKFGQLGIEDSAGLLHEDDSGFEVYSPVPLLVGALCGQQVAQVACGQKSSFAVTERGTVWAWGSAAYGLCGSPDEVVRHVEPSEAIPYRPTPQPVTGLDGQDVVQVASGDCHCLAVTRTGEVWAWGSATYGKLGTDERGGLPNWGDDESDVYQPAPALVLGLQGEQVTHVACGLAHNLAVTLGGDLMAWGSAYHGQLGLQPSDLSDLPTEVENADQVYQPTPARVHMPLGQKVVQAACGREHSLAVTRGGHVWAWGSGTYGKLADGASKGDDPPSTGTSRVPCHMVPMLVTGVPHVECSAHAVGASYAHSIVLLRPRCSSPERMMASMHDWQGVFMDRKSADVEFFVEGDASADPAQRLHAHKALLVARSEYYRSQFTGGMQETVNDEGLVQVKVTDISTHTFRNVLHWLYTDELPICSTETTSEDGKLLLDVLRVSNKLQLPALTALAEAHLKEYITVESSAHIWQHAHETCAPRLEEAAFAFILDNFDEVSCSDEFHQVCKSDRKLMMMLSTCKCRMH
eukprot:gene8304-9865_t